MLTKEKILKITDKKGRISAKSLAWRFGISRQYASGLISELAGEGRLFKIGKTRGAFYVSLKYLKKNPKIMPGRGFLPDFKAGGVFARAVCFMGEFRVVS